MNKEQLLEFKNALEKEQIHLLAEISKIAKPIKGISGEWEAKFPSMGEEDKNISHGQIEDEADEVEEYETRIAAENSLESRLLEIKKALERMEKGNYGICPKCGKEIESDRLKANPEAEFHTEHS